MFGGDAGGIEEDESDDCPVEDLRLDHYSNSNPEKVISSEKMYFQVSGRRLIDCQRREDIHFIQVGLSPLAKKKNEKSRKTHVKTESRGHECSLGRYSCSLVGFSTFLIFLFC